MNNRGFTLIELLATIVVLSLVVGVTVVAVSSFFTRSKDNAEEVFVKELSSIIEDYITLKSSSFVFDTTINEKQDFFTNDYAFPMKEATRIKDGNSIILNNLVDEGLVTKVDLVNPKTGETCNNNASIKVYRDTNYVYCFVTSLNCYTDEDGNRKIITNC